MKVALLIGIDYLDDEDSYIGGCIQDVLDVKKMLIEDLGYEEQHVVVLRDDTNDDTLMPTGDIIMSHILDILSHPEEIDEFWFHYSGHGSQIDDKNGDELDNKDEIILPVDYKTNGVIHDDVFKTITKQIECRTMMVFDCCHSGTICDLPYHYDVVHDTMQYVKQNNDECQNKAIYKISGCRDNQVSLSVYDVAAKQMKGACTSALIEIVKQYNYDITMNLLLKKMNDMMKIKQSEQCPTYATTNPDTLYDNFCDVFSMEDSDYHYELSQENKGEKENNQEIEKENSEQNEEIREKQGWLSRFVTFILKILC